MAVKNRRREDEDDKPRKKKSPRSAGDILRDDVPESGTVRDGGYLCEIEELSAGTSSTGKLMVTGQFTVLEPDEYEGFTIMNWFVIGSDEDPDAENSKTWKKSRGAQDFKKLLVRAGIPMEGDVDDMCEAGKEQKIFLVVVETTATEGERKGEKQNRVRGYFRPGERDPYIDDTEGEEEGSKPRKRLAVAKRRDDDEDEEVEEAPKKKKLTKGEAKHSKDDDDEDEEEEEEEPAPRAKKKKVVEEDEEEEDERPRKTKAKVEEDEDDDEDEDEDEDEEEEEKRPKGRRR